MRGRVVVAIVVGLAFAPACVSTQDLGAWSSSSDAGSEASSASSANPREGFTLPSQTKSCPAEAPTPGDECHVASGECTYARREIDQVGRPVCGRSCTCSLAGKWICAAAPCPYLDATTCGEGFACFGDVQCWADCDRDRGSCRRCVCFEGRMTCTDDTRPPK